MLRRVLAGLAMGAVTATLVLAQAPASPQPPGGGQGRGAGAGEGGRQGGAAGRGGTYLPTEEQGAAMSPKAKEYVDKARTIAGRSAPSPGNVATPPLHVTATLRPSSPRTSSRRSRSSTSRIRRSIRGIASS